MKAFEDLYREHVHAVFRLAMSVAGRREAAEDLTSEAFLALYRNFKHIDESKLPGWLLTVVRNRARGRRRCGAGASHASVRTTGFSTTTRLRCREEVFVLGQRHSMRLRSAAVAFLAALAVCAGSNSRITAEIAQQVGPSRFAGDASGCRRPACSCPEVAGQPKGHGGTSR